MDTRAVAGVPTKIRSPLFVNDTEAAASATSVTCTATSLRTGDDTVLTVTDWLAGTQPQTGRHAAALPAWPNLDVLTLAWEGTIDSAEVTLTQTVRVVGAHYASLPQILAGLPSKPHTDRGRLAELRDEFAGKVQDYCEVSYTRELDVTTVEDNPYGYPRAVFADLPLFSTVVSVIDAADNDVTDNWTLTDSGYWDVTDYGTAPYTVLYEHGVDEPHRLTDACVEWVAGTVLRQDGGSARDVIWQSVDGGQRYSTPDWNAGRPTGFLDVDSTLNALSHRIPGVA